MGSSVSTPEIREIRDGNRLSKQKSTYNVASSDLDSPVLRPDIFHSTTSFARLPTDTEAVIEFQSGVHRSRPEVRQQLRSQLLSADRITSYRNEPMENDDHISELKPSPSRDRLSKSASPQASYTTLPFESQPSLALDPRSVDLQTAVVILEELRKTASPEDLVALHRALLPIRAVDPSLATESTPSAAAVIRRRSLATPGVATRKVSQVARIEGGSNPVSPTYKSDFFEKSPLGRLEDLKRLKNSHAFIGNGEGLPPRSETPGDLDYSHIGNLTLGSLVVTNGAAHSPNASISEKARPLLRPLMDGRVEEEYFTAEESDKSSHEASDSSDVDTIGGTKPVAIQSFCRPALGTIAKQNSKSKGPSKPRESHQLRSGSPLKREVRRTSAHAEGISPSLEVDRDYASRRWSKPFKTLPPPRSLTARYEATSSVEDLVPPWNLEKSRNSTVQVVAYPAIENQSELLESPFISEKQALSTIPLSPGEAPVDDVSYDDKSLREMSPPSVEEDTSMDKTNPPTLNESQVTRQTSLGSHPVNPNDNLPKTTSRLSREKTMSDSGYSSGASASVVENQQGQDSGRSSLSTGSNANPPEPPRAPPAPPHAHVPPKEYDYRNINQEFSKELPSPQPSTQSSVIETVETTEPLPLSADRRSKSWRLSMRLQLPRLLSSDSATSSKSAKSLASSNQSENTAIDTRTPKKLQKKRPISYQAPAVPPPENRIVPRVPSAVQQRFEERPDMFNSTIGTPYEETQRATTPAMDRARPKSAYARARPRPLSSYNTMPNIHDQQERPPLPSQQRRLSLSRLTSSMRPKSSGRAMPQFTTSDEHLPEPNYSLEFASIGSVSNSIGSSPYDAAVMSHRSMNAHQQPPRHSQSNWIKRATGPPNMPLPFMGSHARRTDQYSNFNSGYIDRRRPKSYHGRARRMEVLGEEERETDLAEETNRRGRLELRPVKSFNSSDVANQGVGKGSNTKLAPRPKSVGAPITHSPMEFDSANLIPIPDIPRRMDWSEEERNWREMREDAGRTSHSGVLAPTESPTKLADTIRPTEKYQPNLPAPAQALADVEQSLDLPFISARARLREARPRPMSDMIVSHKSQPDMRRQSQQPELASRLTEFRGSYEGEAMRAQRISANPKLVPTVMKRAGKAKSPTYDMTRDSVDVSA